MERELDESQVRDGGQRRREVRREEPAETKSMNSGERLQGEINSTEAGSWGAWGC